MDRVFFMCFNSTNAGFLLFELELNVLQDRISLYRVCIVQYSILMNNMFNAMAKGSKRNHYILQPSARCTTQ